MRFYSASLVGTGAGNAGFLVSAIGRTKFLPRLCLTGAARVRTCLFSHDVPPSSFEILARTTRQASPLVCLSGGYSISPSWRLRLPLPFNALFDHFYAPRCFLRIAESLIAGFAGANATACLKAAVASSCLPILSKLRPKLNWASADFGSDFTAF